MAPEGVFAVVWRGGGAGCFCVVVFVVVAVGAAAAVFPAKNLKTSDFPLSGTETCKALAKETFVAAVAVFLPGHRSQ